MNLPNKLTLARVLLVPVMSWLILADYIPHNFLWAGLVFGAAALTDMFDGKIARSRNLITDFGKLADPVADKLLVAAAIICFIEIGLCSSWVLIIVLAREFAVTSMRMVAASKGRVIPANMWGKVKTVSQMIAIIAIFVFQWAIQLIDTGIFGVMKSGVFDTVVQWANILGQIFLWITAALTLISGIVYIVQNKDMIGSM
ncbi:MAG: CDP-diacylglycerol--glycerol-3-phosphate 3-phosphatidyltransferase [Clostridia bacterium]|nr:CDP-diacylglycerol--glycerol-3-phosphate 3-phosphatidyltransferase [Clostridia bacterium]